VKNISPGGVTGLADPDIEEADISQRNVDRLQAGALSLAGIMLLSMASAAPPLGIGLGNGQGMAAGYIWCARRSTTSSQPPSRRRASRMVVPACSARSARSARSVSGGSGTGAAGVPGPRLAQCSTTSRGGSRWNWTPYALRQRNAWFG